MIKRIVTALVIGIIMIPFILYGSWPLLTLLLLLAYRTMFEFLRMKNIEIKTLEGFIIYFGITCIVLMRQIISWLPNHMNEYYIFALIVFLTMICATLDKTFNYDEAGFSILGIIYIGFGFYSMYHIRETSLLLLLFIVLSVWISDIAAFLIGKNFGKRKLAPNLSPNKTIEGSISGILGAMVIAVIFLLFAQFTYSDITMVILAGVISIGSQVGDLIESGLKREYNIKDSGRILPGHGGFLDRFDSLLFAMSMCVLLGFA